MNKFRTPVEELEVYDWPEGGYAVVNKNNKQWAHIEPTDKGFIFEHNPAMDFKDYEAFQADGEQDMGAVHKAIVRLVAHLV